MKKILFVCSANKDRSRTAEDLFCELAPNNHYKSAGTNQQICSQLGTTYISLNLLNWADVIYTMENKHTHSIKTAFGNHFSSKITTLHIKDVYFYGNSELKEVFLDKLLKILKLF